MQYAKKLHFNVIQRDFFVLILSVSTLVAHFHMQYLMYATKQVDVKDLGLACDWLRPHLDD